MNFNITCLIFWHRHSSPFSPAHWRRISLCASEMTNSAQHSDPKVLLFSGGDKNRYDRIQLNYRLKKTGKKGVKYNECEQKAARVAAR